MFKAECDEEDIQVKLVKTYVTKENDETDCVCWTNSKKSSREELSGEHTAQLHVLQGTGGGKQ